MGSPTKDILHTRLGAARHPSPTAGQSLVRDIKSSKCHLTMGQQHLLRKRRGHARSPSIVASPLPPKSHSPPLPLVPEMRREERQENEKENKEKENKEMGNKEKEKENNVVS